MVSLNETWKITITATKRNVFFSLSDSNNKVKKLVTPGVLHKPWVRQEDYKKLDERKDRRKKRSLRLFINNYKKSPPACAQAWNILKAYIVSQKLECKIFFLILSGSNMKLSRALGRIFMRSTKLRVSHVILKSVMPHNGCPLKIKKRKKNKGRNKWYKRLLLAPKHKLAVGRGVNRRLVGLPKIDQKNERYWFKKKLEDAFFRTQRVRIQLKNKLHCYKWRPATRLLWLQRKLRKMRAIKVLRVKKKLKQKKINKK